MAVESQPARYLLQAGKSENKVLNRLLRDVHRAGFLVLPHGSGTFTEKAFGRSAGAALGSVAAPEPTPSVTRISRHFDLEHRDYPKGIVGLDADQLRYAGAPPVDAFEIELELRQGPHLLLDLVLAVVAAESALIPARLTDAERAVMAATPHEPQPRSAPGSHLVLDSRWQDLGVAHLKALGIQLQHHEPRAWESLHPEGVHQARVATRRLREALRTFAAVLPAEAATTLVDRLRWLSGILGAVRDLDVQLERLAGYTDDDAGGAHPALDGYRRHLRRRQRQAHRALVAALADPRHLDIGRGLQGLITAALAMDPTAAGPSIAEAGPTALRRQLRRVLRAGRRAARKCAPDRLHRLRIEAKRLRYFLEYVQPVGGPQVTAGIQALNRLQDILGEHQDACVAREDLRRYGKVARVSGRERKVIRRLAAHEAANVARARADFRAEWPAFVRAGRTLVLC